MFTRASIARAAALAAATAALGMALPRRTAAQAAPALETDHRWYPWLGCWRTDTSGTGEQSTSASATCIVPVAGSRSVEALTVARHRVVARDRLDASGRPHEIDGQGCDGMQMVSWSPTRRRALVRADYTCASGTRGATMSIFSILPTGEWLRVEEVRAGGGTTITVTRLHDVGLLPVVPSSAARAIESTRRAIAAARAAAAAPISDDEVADATAMLGAGVVQAWLLASDRQLGLDGRQVAALAVESPLYPRLLAAAPATGNVYMNSSMYVAPQLAEAYQPPLPPYSCVPMNCYNFNPYSPYNGFGLPFGYPVAFSGPVIIRRTTGKRSSFGRPSIHTGPRSGGFKGGHGPRGGHGRR